MKKSRSGVRLGYACQNMTLETVTAAHRVTVKRLTELSRNEQLHKMRGTLQSNLLSLRQILEFNHQHQIQLYRIPSELVPLATHELSADWDYFGEFAEEFQRLGAYIKEHGLRITMHATQYTFLNSPKKRVSQQAIADLHYHTGILDALELDHSAVVVMHIGGIYGDKQKAMHRFIENFSHLSEQAQRRLVLENDDKCYTMQDVLTICEQVKIPAVLDYHHLRCLNAEGELAELLPAVQQSWGGGRMKLHFSSPKNEKEFRSHSDYIDASDFAHFLRKMHRLGVNDFDVMLECKAKDLALLRLRDQCQEFFKKTA